MKYFHFPASLCHTPIRLTDEELEKPELVIKEYFSFYNLNHVRLELGKILELALSTESEEMRQPIHRINLLQFQYQLEALIEAVYAMNCLPK